MSKNDGGPAVAVAREPVDKPEIPRGLMYPKCRPLPGADRLTFSIGICTGVPGISKSYWLTYHDVQVISDGAHTAVQVFVGPSDVVTWERL